MPLKICCYAIRNCNICNEMKMACSDIILEERYCARGGGHTNTPPHRLRLAAHVPAPAHLFSSRCLRSEDKRLCARKQSPKHISEGGVGFS